MTSSHETPRLLPCPFCGSAPFIKESSGEPGLTAVVGCSDVMCSVRPRVLARYTHDAKEKWTRRLSSSSGEPATTDGEKWSFARKCVQRGYDICVQQPDDDAQGLASLDATAADLVKYNWPAATSSLQEDSPSEDLPFPEATRPDVDAENDASLIDLDTYCAWCGLRHDRPSLDRDCGCSRHIDNQGTAKCNAATITVSGSSGTEPAEGSMEAYAEDNAHLTRINSELKRELREERALRADNERILTEQVQSWYSVAVQHGYKDPRVTPEPAGETVETEALPSELAELVQEIGRTQAHVATTCASGHDLTPSPTLTAAIEKVATALRSARAAITKISEFRHEADSRAHLNWQRYLAATSREYAVRSALLDARREIAVLPDSRIGGGYVQHDTDEPWVLRSAVLAILDRVGGQER